MHPCTENNRSQFFFRVIFAQRPEPDILRLTVPHEGDVLTALYGITGCFHQLQKHLEIFRLLRKRRVNGRTQQIALTGLSYPNLHYHITSGGTEQVLERLNKGILDFAVLVETPDYSKYSVLEFPETDKWGIVIPKNHPLAEKDVILVDDLIGLPLFCSEQSWHADIPRWAGNKMDRLRLEGSFQLAYNGSIFAAEDLGVLLTFDKLVNTGSESPLTFRPLSPVLENKMYLVWKKYQVFSPIAERFITKLRESLEKE